MVAAGVLIALSLAGQADDSSKDEGLSIDATLRFEAKLYAEPDLEAPLVTVLPAGTEITVRRRPNRLWLEVSHDDHRGYLTEGHLEMEDRTAIVAAVTGVSDPESMPRRLDGSSDLEFPKPIRSVHPKMPESARGRRVEGDVVVEVIIRSDGSVEPLRVLQSLDEELDAIALETAAQWQFEPARHRGEPIDVLAEIVLSFRLL